MHHLSLGQQGEAIAQAYVRRHCSVLHVNWKSGRREIDIIAGKDNNIYFIEVKTRCSDRYGWPEEAVNYKKEEHIRSVASDYLLQYGLHPVSIRFDIIAITFYGDTYDLMHLRDVF
ncbi:YraN family protein [Chitinophaga polysaccharea]|uniref:YraN family protein n=1 Tax=Chitinophaga TaxID=79328 RepID=UPI0014558211|nr:MULTISPECIES: YraN family protein [Chitinophaga]NLR58063.1 YraN family protein [Chitinophaga polysaccharea]NLU93656.1 YraN family protein [Chitinophaga sp. Ak27]